MKMLQEMFLVIVEFSRVLVDSQVTSFNCSDDNYAYIRPDNKLRPWNEAQTVCRNSGATLPIVDNPPSQSCFAEALSYFQMNMNGSSRRNVWLGANSSGAGSYLWRWLTGSLYNGTIDPTHFQYNYYAYVTLARNNQSVTILSSRPSDTYYYICLYPTTDRTFCENGSNQTAHIRDGRCFVKNNEKLSWFNARNRCLTNGGDLASFPDISLLKGLIDSNWFTKSLNKNYQTYYDDRHWIGLRRSSWNWRDAVTGLSTDVTFTRWDYYQPRAEYYLPCIAAVSTDYGLWRNEHCASHETYICQVTMRKGFSSKTPTSYSSSSSSSKDFASLFQSSTTQIQSSNEKRSNAPDDNGITSINDSSNLRVGLGAGLGIGVPFLLIILILAFLLIRQTKKSRKAESSLPEVDRETTGPAYESLQRGTAALQSPVYQELSTTKNYKARNSQTYEYVN